MCKNFIGKILIGLLASYQHPDDGKDRDRERFDLIERFVRQLLHLPQARLEVDHNKQIILLKNNDLRLPLSSYGTGVHELVILVTAVLSVDNSICCVEEPEIHLHPRLQREFIEFITTETTNQYLISTHSPTFINAFSANNNVQVFHLRLENDATIGGPITKDEESLHALHDLGIKASDILQSNCVLWVEGPSDRIYLKRWLDLTAPELAEGRDYSIMFYGGRLLSHLNVDRDGYFNNLIHVLRINQHAIVMIDSDRPRSNAEINPTKRRIQEECERSGNVCWITDGREVENYLPDHVVIATCQALLENQIDISIKPYAKFEQMLSNALKASGAKNIDYSADKVKYAREFTQHFELADMSDELRAQVDKVVAKIRLWNA